MSDVLIAIAYLVGIPLIWLVCLLITDLLLTKGKWW